MNRVIVIGCPGSGKSTFARKLRDRTGLPLYYLDRLWHRPDRTTVSRAEFDAALDAILDTPAWIIDGNYHRTIPKRLARCDRVFFLDLPVEVCLEGVQSRIGQVREDMPWVEEAFDPEFRRWITDFPTEQLPQIRVLLADFKGEVTVFHTREEADAFFVF